MKTWLLYVTSGYIKPGMVYGIRVPEYSITLCDLRLQNRIALYDISLSEDRIALCDIKLFEDRFALCYIRLSDYTIAVCYIILSE
jgi:hypothetical protein